VPGASIGILRNGRVTATAATGVVNVDTAVPTTVDTVFQIGSISKIFTTTLVMQLRDEGLIDLDLPIINYLPTFRVADAGVQRQVTARHFLSHTSGIDGDFFPDSGRGDDAIERFVDMCAMLPSLYPPGAMMSYCNVGFAVLGRVIEVLTRKTYDQAMRERIFDPLEMTHALTRPEDTLRFRCAIGHVADSKRPDKPRVTPMPYLSHGQKAAGATPAMAVEDLLKFAAAHLHGGRGLNGGKLLKAGSVAEMRKRQVKLPRHSPRAASGWGLGWLLSDWRGARIIGHDGGTIGQFSFLRVSPKHKLAIALLTNGGDAVGLYDDVMRPLWKHIAHLDEPNVPDVNDRLKPELTRYAGAYENIANRVEFHIKRGRLVGSSKSKMGIVGNNLFDLPVAFVDKSTARLVSSRFRGAMTRIVGSTCRLACDSIGASTNRLEEFR